MHSKLSIFRVFVVAICSLVCARACFAATPVAPANDDRIVVMISVDGLANFYLDDPKAQMPTIRRLAQEGVRANGMKASNPTVTWPNHTTLVTGASPAQHGVVGNNYLDRATGEVVRLIADPVYDKSEIVKVPTIYDVAKASGLKTASIRWPATRNAQSLDWTLPDVHSDELMRKYTTPALFAECKAAGYPLVEARKLGVSLDDMWTDVFNMILKNHRPNLALLHLVDVDHTEHIAGPRSPEAYAAIEKADRLVARVWDELQRGFPGKATLIVVSDHGFSPINKTILPNVVLRDAGLIETRGNRVTNARARVVGQGGAAFVYVLDDVAREETTRRVKDAFKDIEGVQKIVDSEGFADIGVADPHRDPHAPDFVLFAKMGYVFGDTAAGQLPFQEKPERKGSHGHNAELSDLHATFVAWGVGINAGEQLGEIDNRSVAPTIARLLDIELPNVEGEPLVHALAE